VPSKWTTICIKQNVHAIKNNQVLSESFYRLPYVTEICFKCIYELIKWQPFSNLGKRDFGLQQHKMAQNMFIQYVVLLGPIRTICGQRDVNGTHAWLRKASKTTSTTIYLQEKCPTHNRCISSNSSMTNSFTFARKYVHHLVILFEFYKYPVDITQRSLLAN
jgi:hypothetical protein